jgi:NADPH2:quinone reductase
MRKISILQTGGPDALQLVSTISPTTGRNEVLVDVEAAGVNYVDVLQRVGHSEFAKPYTPGLEGVGTITEVGPGAVPRCHGAVSAGRIPRYPSRQSYAATRALRRMICGG